MPECEEDYDQDFGDCYLKWISLALVTVMLDPSGPVFGI